MVTRNKVIHRFVKNRDEYINETGEFYYQIIPENVQAYSIKFDPEYPDDYTKCKLYYVLGTGGSTYAEIANGEGKDITGNPTFSKEFLVSSENDIKDLIKEYVQSSSGIVTYTDLDEGRKTVLLANYDSISGLDTEGIGYNLVMVSKWNVADFGSPGLHLNFNTLDDITVNDKYKVLTSQDQVVNYIEVDGKSTLQFNNGQSLSALDIDNNNQIIAELSSTNTIELGNINLSTNINTKDKLTINGTDVVATLKDLEGYLSSADLDSKLDKNLGKDNANKILTINSNGDIVPSNSANTAVGLMNYDLSSQIDGNTTKFIIADSTITDFVLFYNGIKQNSTTYSFDNTTRIITTNFKPTVGETLDILYIKTK